jgi:hypothetical protein
VVFGVLFKKIIAEIGEDAGQEFEKKRGGIWRNILIVKRNRRIKNLHINGLWT